MSEEMSLIEADFKNLDREKITRDECVMMVIDGPLISDEAILYFLPELVKCTLKDGGHHYMLSQRLKSLDNSKLHITQDLIIKEVIQALKDYEEAEDKEDALENESF